MIALLLACATPEESTTGAVAPLPVVELPAPLLLRRMSLDLRGMLPSLEELDAVEADAAALPALRDAMLEDPRVQERLVDLLAEQYLTRADGFNVTAGQFGLGDEDAGPFVASVGEEPLRLAAWIAASGQPWTEVARSEYTLANDLLLSIWPLQEAPEAGGADLSGWRPARYTDGRPAGGIVMTNGFAWRFSQAVHARSHAAAISDLLLCDDYLDRPINFATASLLEHEELEEATREEPLCQSCHSSLDPVAAALLGFYAFEMYDVGEVSTYHPEREALGPYLLGSSPRGSGRRWTAPRSSATRSRPTLVSSPARSSASPPGSGGVPSTSRIAPASPRSAPPSRRAISPSPPCSPRSRTARNTAPEASPPMRRSRWRIASPPVAFSPARSLRTSSSS